MTIESSSRVSIYERGFADYSDNASPRSDVRPVIPEDLRGSVITQLHQLRIMFADRHQWIKGVLKRREDDGLTFYCLSGGAQEVNTDAEPWVYLSLYAALPEAFRYTENDPSRVLTEQSEDQRPGHWSWKNIDEDIYNKTKRPELVWVPNKWWEPEKTYAQLDVLMARSNHSDFQREMRDDATCFRNSSGVEERIIRFNDAVDTTLPDIIELIDNAIELASPLVAS